MCQRSIDILDVYSGCLSWILREKVSHRTLSVRNPGHYDNHIVMKTTQL